MVELSGLIAHHASFRPDVTAVVFGDSRLSYRAFGGRVARAGNLLRSLGIRRGDKVATACGNALELLEACWAVPSIGATLVPLSPLLMGPSLASLLEGSDASALVAQRSMLPALEGIRERLPSLVLLTDGAAEGCVDYRARAAAMPEHLEAAAVSPEDLFNIMFTSGTTGQPKGIMLPHRVRAMYGVLFASAFRMTPESRTLHSGAIVFNGAFVTMMPTFHLGATYVLMPQFDPEATIDTIERERITHAMLVPAQIVTLFASPRFDPPRLRSLECILWLGAPLLLGDRERLNALLPGRLYELYGLTEGFVTILDRDDAVRKACSVGVPPVFSALRIVRDDAQEATPPEAGEIVGRSPITMTGYYKRPDLTAETLRDGWIHIGDVGDLDDEGHPHLVDRKKDMIDSGGVKVYPRDIEEIAARDPDIREVAVFGVPHAKWGETPLAAVILRDGATTPAESLRDWISERVAARYQRVSQVVVLPDFPPSTAGRTLKRAARTLLGRAGAADLTARTAPHGVRRGRIVTHAQTTKRVSHSATSAGRGAASISTVTS